MGAVPGTFSRRKGSQAPGPRVIDANRWMSVEDGTSRGSARGPPIGRGPQLLTRSPPTVAVPVTAPVANSDAGYVVGLARLENQTTKTHSPTIVMVARSSPGMPSKA